MKPACMTDGEWDEWNAPLLGRKPTGYPCQDCPIYFAVEQRALGSCNGIPHGGLPGVGGRRQTYPTDVAVARRRAQWREYNRKRRARKRVA